MRTTTRREVSEFAFPSTAKCLLMKQELLDLKGTKEREEGKFDAIINTYQKDLEKVSKHSETLKEEQTKQILDLKGWGE
eukprot:12862074-Ditylum_brightwellii.AAC.1